MSFAKQIMIYLESLPAEVTATSVNITKRLGFKSSTVGTTLRDKLRQGVIDRVEVGRTITNKPVYGYYAVAKPAPKLKEWKAKPRVKKTPIIEKGTQQTSLDGMVVAFVDEFAEMLSSLLVRTLQPKIEAKLREVLPQALPKINAPIKQEVLPAKKKVLIVGLLNNQCGHISQEFGEVFDLDFVGSDCINGQLKAKVLHSDLVVTMTKFISHASEEVTLSAGGNLRRCPGGMSQLRELLTKEYVG